MVARDQSRRARCRLRSCAHAPADAAHTEPKGTRQRLLVPRRQPGNVIAVMENAVATGVVSHDHDTVPLHCSGTDSIRGSRWICSREWMQMQAFRQWAVRNSRASPCERGGHWTASGVSCMPHRASCPGIPVIVFSRRPFWTKPQRHVRTASRATAARQREGRGPDHGRQHPPLRHGPPVWQRFPMPGGQQCPAARSLG